MWSWGVFGVDSGPLSAGEPGRSGPSTGSGTGLPSRSGPLILGPKRLGPGLLERRCGGSERKDAALIGRLPLAQDCASHPSWVRLAAGKRRRLGEPRGSAGYRGTKVRSGAKQGPAGKRSASPAPYSVLRASRAADASASVAAWAARAAARTAIQPCANAGKRRAPSGRPARQAQRRAMSTRSPRDEAGTDGPDSDGSSGCRIAAWWRRGAHGDWRRDPAGRLRACGGRDGATFRRHRPVLGECRHWDVGAAAPCRCARVDAVVQVNVRRAAHRAGRTAAADRAPRAGGWSAPRQLAWAMRLA